MAILVSNKVIAINENVIPKGIRLIKEFSNL
jgi:hypothetical protein